MSAAGATAAKPSQGTCFSRPFVLVEAVGVRTEDPKAGVSRWEFLPAPPVANGERASISEKWVYVFQKLEGGVPALYAEIEAGKDRILSMAVGATRRLQSVDAAAKPKSTGASKLVLPHTVNGTRALYYFVATRLRLGKACIRAMEAAPPDLLPLVDLASNTAYLPCEGGSKTWAVVVVDPVTVAHNLQVAYEQACNNLLAYTTEYEGQSQQEKAQVRQRNQTHLLAKLLGQVLDSDPKDKLGLKNELKDKTGGQVKSFVRTHERTIALLIKERDRRCVPLACLLSSQLWKLAESWYRACEKDDYGRWLTIMSAVTCRLRESPVGRACMGKIIADKAYFLDEYILPSDGLNENHFQVARKVGAAVLQLWAEFAPEYINLKKPGKDVAQFVCDALKLVTRSNLVTVATETVTTVVRTRHGFQRVAIITPVIKPVEPDPHRALAAWMKDGKVAEALTHLSKAIEVLNITLALGAIFSSDNKLEASVNLVGSLLDGVSAFKTLFKLSGKALRWIGAVSAALDAVMAAKAGYQAYTANDYSVLVGQGLVCTGSVLLMIAGICAATGLGAGATVVGLPLTVVLEALAAILVAAGWIVAAFTADSPLEAFTNHCYFGKHHGQGSDQPKWADGKFASWAEPGAGIERQLRTMFNLLGGFVVDSADYTAAFIKLGMVGPESQLQVRMVSRYNLGITHDVTYFITPATREVKSTGDPADLSLVNVSCDQQGRYAVTVRADWPKGKSPEMAIQHQWCVCDARLFLQPGYPVPLSGPVQYRVHQLGTGLSLSSVRSNDF